MDWLAGSYKLAIYVQRCNAGQYLEEWGPLSYQVTDARFTIKLEMKDSTLVDWVSCVPSEGPREKDHSLYQDEDLSWFIHLACNITRILPPSPISGDYYALESLSTSFGPKISSLNIELDLLLNGGLVGMHMLWDRDERLLVLKIYNECWERVGTLECYRTMDDGVN